MAKTKLRAWTAELLPETARALRSWDVGELDGLAEAALRGPLLAVDVRAALVLHLEPIIVGAHLTLARRIAMAEGFTLHEADVTTPAAAVVEHVVALLTPGALKALAPIGAEAKAGAWEIRRASRALRRIVTLTASQAAALEPFRQKVTAKAHRLRREGKVINQADIGRAVERFRVRLERRRAKNVASQELWRAGQTAQAAVWAGAAGRNEISLGHVTKTWRCRASGVRDSHVDLPTIYAAGIGLSESFVTTLGRLRYPLDPQGVAADVIGCRCNALYRISTGET